MIPFHKQSRRSGLTLVELMVAAAIMGLVVVLLTTVVSNVSKTWKRAETQITRFQSARFAFERMTRSLSQATLNPYWDYLDANGNRRTPANSATFSPKEYARCSDQHFLISPAATFATSGTGWACFFQAPLGYTASPTPARLDNLLNATGYFAEFNNDNDPATRSLKPAFITTSKWRSRLMELRQKTESLEVFQTSGSTWITSAMGPGREARPVADNVVALVFLAKDGKGNPVSSKPDSYLYDSRDNTSQQTWNQLPPEVQVTMVVIDEDSAARLAAQNGSTAPGLLKPEYFVKPADFADDLRNLENDLSNHAARPDYRIFNATVRIESAKWSD